MKKILIPVTNHAFLGNTEKPNGTYAPELTHAVHEFAGAGYDYDIASIHGGEAPVYGLDVEGDEVNRQVLQDTTFTAKLKSTLAVADVNGADYHGIFYPGGYGLLTDLAKDAQFAGIAMAHFGAGKVLGAVCHGPSAFLPMNDGTGTPFLSDKSVTGFTREEEIDYETIHDVPFLLEEELARKARLFSKKQPWLEHVVVDGRLVTGQNPASARGVARKMVEQI